ncbi:hypothetical protein J416_11847 [Gracilibacillus halophilus YIM-C55.5]|uniref:Uncharacterized protein n=1 Tax=Gracilibacillus halophilus YIM-C55.5 TaxID=1308866 RepID=N4WNY1_9BACI|nr:hypothetical protein [Gracilibacillus halophilus]ENH96195.1 hypothetical protein J416_11847 [Gracilibacillus halophilus YIM-C55.5]
MYKFVASMLGIYDLFLATGAIVLGVQMVTLKNGTIFSGPFPDSWSANLPFDGWIIPGVWAIAIFGFGNISAAILSFRGKHNSSWYASSLMGAVFLFGLAYQYIAVGEWYIVTSPFIILGVIQLCLSGFVLLLKYKRK